MRIPLPVQFKTRQGDVTKDARIKNGYVEIKGEVGRVRKRPGNADLGLIEAGAAQLLACWNGLLSVVGDSLASLVITTVPPGYLSSAIDFNTFPTHTPSDASTQCVEWVNGEFLMGIYDEDNSAGELISVVKSGASVVLSQRLAVASGVDTTPYGIAQSATTIAIVTFNDYGLGSNEGEIWTAPLAAVPYVFTQRSTSATYGGRSIKYGGTTFVAVLSDLSSASRIRYSTDDGVNWTERTRAGEALFDCCYDSTKWWFTGVASGSVLVLSSTDLTTFTTESVTGLGAYTTMQGIVYSAAHGYFGRMNSPFDIVKSSDGIAWTVVSGVGAIPNDVITDSAGDVFVLSGADLYIYDGSDFVLISSDGAGEVIAANNSVFCTSGSNNFSAHITVTETGGGDEVTATPITDLSPVTPSLALFAEATGSAQSQQQLFIKSDDQAWIYTE